MDLEAIERIKRAQQDIADHVGSRGQDCLACGSEGTVEPDAGLVGLMIAEFDPNRGRNSSGAEEEGPHDGVDQVLRGLDMVRMDALAFVCSECGFIRFHQV